MLPWRYVYCFRRRRTCGKTTGIDGQHPKYDKLDRGLSYYNALHHQNICSLEVPQEITITETLREHNHRSFDFSELRKFMRASESDVCSEETIERGVKEQTTSFHRRRFSVFHRRRFSGWSERVYCLQRNANGFGKWVHSMRLSKKLENGYTTP